MKLKLKEKRPEAGDVVTFIFEPEAPFSWRAGQYLHYTIPGEGADDRGAERWFTIAAAPHEREVHITTRISPKRSTFKDHLNNLEVGDTLEADGPEGDFIVEDPEQPIVALVGGIGITPLRAIFLDLDNRHLPIRAKLLYANRDENFVFKHELDALAARHPEFSITYISGERHIDEDLIRAEVQDLAQPLFYISGPEPMVRAMEKMLESMGVPERHLKRDDFPGYTWP